MPLYGPTRIDTRHRARASRIGHNLATAFKDIGRVNQELRQHLVLTIDPRFKAVSYDPDADETLQQDG